MCSMPDPPPARRSDDTHVIANTLSPQGRKVELTERKWAYVQHFTSRCAGSLEAAACGRFVSPTYKRPESTPRTEALLGFAPTSIPGFNG